MSLLLNRKYGSRLECLYYILQCTYANYGMAQSFSLGDLKFGAGSHTVHQYCGQLTQVLGRQCCPYLSNPLDASKCYATQSIQSDSTKTKAASDIGGSLEALGMIEKKSARKYVIAARGIQWLQSKYGTAQWEDIARQGVLSYGVAVGFLSKISEFPDTFSRAGLYLSYPTTKEVVQYIDAAGQSKTITLSEESKKDSNTRTKTRLIAWAVTTGLLEPVGVKGDASPLAHLKYRDFLNQDKQSKQTFKKTALGKTVFDQKFLVENPLSYRRLQKNVASLREKGGEDLRAATLQHKESILARRYVFVYALAQHSVQNKGLDFTKLVQLMQQEALFYFSSGGNAMQIMQSESDIAEIVGIPFTVEDNGLFWAKTTIRLSVLNEEAPAHLVRRAEQMMIELGR